MKRLISLILSLAVVAAAFLGIRHAHRIYSSLWLDIYLALFVALPLLLGIQGVMAGRQGFKNFFRSFFSVTAGLLIATLIYQKVTENWLWACLAGAVLPGIVTIAREWRVSKARMNLTLAEQALKARQYEQALKLAQEARSAFIVRGNHEQQALAEQYLGIAYAQTGEPTRAARYLSSALALFRSLDNKEQVKQTEGIIAQLRRVGVTSTVSDEPTEEEVGRVDWSFVLNGILSIAFALIFLRLWEIEVFQASWPVIGAFGLALFLLIYGNYAVITLTTAPSRERRGTWGLLLLFYTAGLLLLLFSSTSFFLEQETFQIADFPSAFQGSLARLSSLVEDLPSWSMPGAIFVGVLVMLGVVVVASGRSPVSLLGPMLRGDPRRRALQLAMGHLDTGEWDQAIAQLTRFDILREKNLERKKAALFCLGFAHHMAEHPREARQYTRELLEIDGQHKEGLYLAGYLALQQEDQIDEAEAIWRKLYAIDPRFHPHGGRGADGSVGYYLCRTLYRKAMTLMKQDVEEGAKLLAEVGEIGDLDKEVSDALIRVHLYRCTQLVRRRQWDQATHEVNLAQHKLKRLQKLVEDPAEISKISGLCQAAGGLIAFRQEQYDQTEDDFSTALETTKDIARKGEFFARPGRSFLEQLLRAVVEMKEEGEKRISPSFTRDLYFLTSLAQLRRLHERLATSSSPEWESILPEVKARLEESIASDPDFVEGRAMLGLLYYYLGEDEATREKGAEILQTIRERVGSKFVAQTVTQYEEHKRRREDARKTYFDLLQQYLQFSTVPRKEREALRESVLEDMKTTGQYEIFVGRGSLEIEAEREREPTVQEYVDRADLLREKLRQLGQLNRTGDLPREVQTLVETLNQHNEKLQETIQMIAETERELLLQAQGLL